MIIDESFSWISSESPSISISTMESVKFVIFIVYSPFLSSRFWDGFVSVKVNFCASTIRSAEKVFDAAVSKELVNPNLRLLILFVFSKSISFLSSSNSLPSEHSKVVARIELVSRNVVNRNSNNLPLFILLDGLWDL
ncbi:hypothetical protein CMI38_02530 [Candidatus Pacearchaeota archaeon]|nr:hypothetical protein [Candidatus Pacearchaeota archaeon]